ncbi:hypothetical protein ACJIZ3_024617 [Penstemon smallii]|uniref:Chaperone DnaJ C-terminal domain-containing protein n=1 Tax=Penstemon smallii TaxID=265156 RepID=A0ABD3TTM6_9LAMI
MADQHSRSHSQNLFHILGFGSICRACKSFASKCYPDKNSSFSKKKENKTTRPKSNQEDTKTPPKDRLKDTNPDKDNNNMHQIHHDSTRASFKHHDHNRSPLQSSHQPVSRSMSFSHLSSQKSINRPSSLLRSTSRINQTDVPPTTASLLKSLSKRNSMKASSASAALQRSFSRSASRKGSTPIMYSNSHGIMKPPPMEQQLNCTLEELCFGCVKKITITRDTITEDGQIIEEDEVLTIKVKPGWTKGTKITFEGMGNELPGTDPADVILIVAEEKHPLFRREGDDLELGVEIPLVEALTGCTLSVPLLGEQATSLTIDAIIYPGYVYIIAGKGMPKQYEPGTRGNLKITFLVKFPEDLVEEQRSDVVNILQHTC